MPGIGDNVDSEALMLERLIRVTDEKKEKDAEIKDLYAEAKGKEISVDGLKLAVKRHYETTGKRQKREDTEEEAARMLRGLGQLGDTPLGNAARERAGA